MTIPEKAVFSILRAACPYKNYRRPYLIWINLAFMCLVVLVSLCRQQEIFNKVAEIISRFLNRKSYVLFLFEVI